MIPVYPYKTIPYDSYLRLSHYFRKKRKENLMFCDHYPVITAGMQFQPKSLKVSEEWLKLHQIDFFHVKRGGDVTAHELGQIIIYPHIDLRKRKILLQNFIDMIVSITKQTVKEIFQIELEYKKDMPGFYFDDQKVISMGLEIRAGFSSSGLAINYKNDLKTFRFIHPCGYENLKMTTIEQILENQKKITNQEKKELYLEAKKIDFCKRWEELFCSYLD
ncbi:MAG: lipoyl(octanoyl) transferase LipB [Leptospiraceae bacterium]|nr:lipoyl(octanoyl) transferase LipB [Leptospiraceae bacterium]MDW7975980.1 lipoyl(octanoyl) transferase LipB [Leptospiraceae bacterium]